MSARAGHTPIGYRTPRPRGTQPESSDDASGGRPANWRALGKRIAAALLAAGVIAILLAIAASASRWKTTGESFECCTVSRGDLSIRLIARGNLESQENLDIKCDVDDVPGDGIAGTTILWLAPNGSLAKKGDLLVELDSASHEKQVDDQVLENEEERAHLLQHTARYENQITRNETTSANAELGVKLSDLNLQSFEDDDGGVFQLGLQDVEMQIQLAEAKKLISETDLTGHEMLYNLGYSSSGDLAQAQLAALNANGSLARAVSERKLQVEYEYHKQKLRLTGATETAKRNVVQVKRNNEWMLARELALKHSAERRLKKDEERLARYREQVENCKIYAPQDGMVVHASGIDEGDAVYQRRTILMLPNLTKMQVKTNVHESGVNQVKPGMAATVRLDARQGVMYEGSVKSVAVLPDQSNWLNSDVKLYETIVTIDEEVERLQPGMTAVVEIDVNHLNDVLLAPVEAIIQIDGDDWCYVDAGGDVERRMVTLGGTNDQFVEIQEGLSEGDRVILDPAAISETAQRQEQTISPEFEMDVDFR